MFTNFFIQPFDINYNKYQRYIYVSIEDNRVYKDFYIISNTDISGFVKIMVVCVCKDGKVLTYFNDKESYDAVKQASPNADVYYSPIKLLTKDKKYSVYINLFFRSKSNEKIEIKLNCIKKIIKKRHSIKPKNGIFRNSKSSVFYSSKILRASNRSSVVIMGREYNIKRMPTKHFSFAPLQMLYVQDLGVINIFNKTREFKIISTPDLFCEGAKFEYQGEEGIITYTIDKIQDELLFISSARDKIIAKNVDRGLSIEKIFITMHPEAPEISFYPSLNLLPIGDDADRKHKFRLTMGNSSVTGEVFYSGDVKKGFVLHMVCDKIGWTNTAPLVSAVVFGDNTFKITTGIMKNDLDGKK